MTLVELVLVETGMTGIVIVAGASLSGEGGLTTENGVETTDNKSDSRLTLSSSGWVGGDLFGYLFNHWFTCFLCVCRKQVGWLVGLLN